MKHITYAFLLALVAYIVCYAAIEYRRTRNGPWQVTFQRSEAGSPALLINQPRLGITNVQILFTGETAPASMAAVNVDFQKAQPVPFEVPFGKCVFLDTTFLPGTVVLQLFGHEIGLLPRVLIIDRQEHPWPPPRTITLPTGRAAPVPASL